MTATAVGRHAVLSPSDGDTLTCLVGISCHLPNPTPIRSIQDELGLDAVQLRRFERYFGLSSVCRTQHRTESDLLLTAVRGLEAMRGREDDIRYVVRARTALEVAPYPIDPMDEVCRAAGLERAVRFALTGQLCAAGLYAVELCGRLLAADNDPRALALVLAGERAFTPAGYVIANTAVMGEGVAAVLVGTGGERDRLLGHATQTYGEYHSDLVLNEQAAAAFQRLYPSALVSVMRTAADRAGVNLADIDMVLPHNVNRLSWIRICEMAGLPMERLFLDNLAVTGHCYGADPFINYQTSTEKELMRPGDRYLMTSVGLGASFSAMVFQH